MSNADQFLLYAKEALLLALSAESDDWELVDRLKDA